ncbi:hypothetical protein TIFTF001_000331 [Ficus carica]|uniref:SHSP domain-containing protein n=1 Tax=Ficus carica TaxID=3494 RepID=A0AA87YVF8_FICCA|nr:hypothetical protein TIFTF001_000331 [Ficus carica]
MYWQESTLVVSANASGWRMEEVRVECRNRKVILLLGSNGEGSSSGSGFTKSLCSLPANVNIGEITTEIHNGMLTVTVPKATIHKKRPNKNTITSTPARHAAAHDHVVSPSRRPGRFFC